MTVALRATISRLELISMLLVPRVLTGRLLEFARGQGVLDAARELGGFTAEELAERLGYAMDGRTRRRMVSVLLDFLNECGVVHTRGGARFLEGPAPWHRALQLRECALSPEEDALCRENFSGQVEFFDECISTAGGFLKGGEAPIGFTPEQAPLWDGFLGNYEYSTMRRLLLRLMGLKDSPGVRVMDLCYGVGHGLADIRAEYPRVEITAVDNRSTYRQVALGKLERHGMAVHPPSVRWVDEAWQGFGSRLPFGSESFDAVQFACSEPYLPPAVREGFYSEVFRVLKPGGALGVLAWGYPDKDARIVKDPWIRRYVLAHDFAESVCSGWQGFYDMEGSRRMFSRIGFERDGSVSGFDSTLGASLNLLRRPL